MGCIGTKKIYMKFVNKLNYWKWDYFDQIQGDYIRRGLKNQTIKGPNYWVVFVWVVLSIMGLGLGLV